MAKISVIVPNFNHSRYLRQRIDSILGQTFQDFELLILDDCSTDNSRSIIESYRENPKVTQIVYNELNSGSTFIQWKKGIELAQGEWIWIAESDDWCEKTLLEELFRGALQNSDCKVSYCQSIMTEENEILWISNAGKLEQMLDGKTFVVNHMLKGNSIFNASMAIFKRSCSLEVSDEFLKYKYSGDWLFWTEIALLGNVYISGKALNYFRKHKNDVSSPAFKSGLSYTDYFQILNYLERKYSLIGDKRDELLSFKFKQFINDQRIQKEYRKELHYTFKSNLNRTYYYLAIWLSVKSLIRRTKNRLPNNLNSCIKKVRFRLLSLTEKKITIPSYEFKREEIKKNAVKYNLKILIETGTFQGDTVEYFKNKIPTIFSIELSKDLAAKAKQRFASSSNVQIIQGDSGEILENLISDINQAAIFWLDGHYSSEFYIGDEYYITAKGKYNTPIIAELTAILEHNLLHVILIDDARLFVGTGDYPSITLLRNILKETNDRYHLTVKNDIIYILPNE